LLGVNPFFVKDYRSAKTRFSQEQLLHILHQIRLADGYTRGLEAGSRQDEDIFKDLIIQIVRC
jgi:DNA polymerase-3 subunit delta